MPRAEFQRGRPRILPRYPLAVCQIVNIRRQGTKAILRKKETISLKEEDEELDEEFDEDDEWEEE